MDYCAANLDVPTRDWIKLIGEIGPKSFYPSDKTNVVMCGACKLCHSTCSYCDGHGTCQHCEDGVDEDGDSCYYCYGSETCDECGGSGFSDDCGHYIHSSNLTITVKTKITDQLKDSLMALGAYAFKADSPPILNKGQGDSLRILFPNTSNSSTQPKVILRHSIRLRSYIAKELCSRHNETEQATAMLKFLVKEMAHEVSQKEADKLAVEHGLKKKLPKKKPIKKITKKPVKKAKKGKK